MTLAAQTFHSVAFVDGKTFANRDTLKAVGCHWNAKSKIWTRKLFTQADLDEFQGLLRAHKLTARIVLADGKQALTQQVTRCPPANAERFAVIAHYGADVAFVRSFITSDAAERLAKQLKARYGHRGGFAVMVVTEFQPSTKKWAELRQHLDETQRSNFHSGRKRSAIGAQSPKP